MTFLRSTVPQTFRSRRVLTRSLVGVVVVALAWSAGGPLVAGAATLGGKATISAPGATTALSSGGSTTQFTVTLPAQAACSGDSATGGYLVYSYLVKEGAALSGVTFVNLPSVGYGLVDALGTYYGAVNTAVKTGQIVGIPNDFEWGPLVTTDGGSVALTTLLYGGSTGVWEAGIACANKQGALTDNWNTQVTFTASSSDPHGFDWSAVPGTPAGSSPPTTTTTVPPTTTTTAPATTAAAASASTSTTAPSSAGGATVAAADTSGGGSSSPDASGGSTPTGSSGAADPTLAFTGIDLARDVGIGVLCLGIACLLLGWRYRKRSARVTREAHLPR